MYHRSTDRHIYLIYDRNHLTMNVYDSDKIIHFFYGFCNEILPSLTFFNNLLFV